MRKNQKIIKLFFVLLFCTAFIFGSSQFGAQTFGKIKRIDKKDTTATTSGSLNKSKNGTANKDHSGVKSGGEIIILNQSRIKLKDIPFDLQTVLNQGSEIKIPEQSTFSLLEFVKKQKIANISSDTLSLIASGIYQAILPSHFSIVERNIGTSLTDCVNLGFEAKINLDQNIDLVFLNQSKSRYTIELELVDKSLNVSLKGEKFPYPYKLSLKNKQSFNPRTIIQYSPLILTGKVKVVTAGTPGQLIEVYRDVYQGEQLLKSEFVSKDYYPPVHRVEIHSLNTPRNNQGFQASTETVTQEGGQAENQSNIAISPNGDQNSNSSNTPAKKAE